ncbi:hypothetical protein [Clostridium tyrobutyricum]|uniref:hypothetical protein n=1 Tax=Clostridium tyrobutyricum TaxID=1519 RepID=UPI00073D4A61|nr:hypothetical protein [Clostridium tyrobutyricum]MBV4416404.1 VCBS repeat-containing protein [Clostridium tyrobutyricum]MBV4422525.1 VCBS repeat-containing protein [Clostridium tyrobutyricum]
MKLRVIFLKKKYLFFLMPLILFLIILVLIIYRNYTTSSTFTTISKDTILKSDLNGDGIKDSLYVKQANNKYLIKVKIKDKIFDINTDDKSSILSNYYTYWPLRVTLMDISRDRIPEIFLQGSLGKNSVQRIFVFDGNNFKNIISNSNNILGFIDCTNNRTPKVITGRFQGDIMLLTNYIFSNSKFKNYNLEDNPGFLGKDTVCSFINFIQTLPSSRPYEPNNIFSSNISSDDMYVLDKLAKSDTSYTFQDAIFKEKKSDKNGNSAEVQWTLNFKGVSNSDTSIIKNYSINIILDADKNSSSSNYFKIVSIY